MAAFGHVPKLSHTSILFLRLNIISNNIIFVNSFLNKNKTDFIGLQITDKAYLAFEMGFVSNLRL